MCIDDRAHVYYRVHDSNTISEDINRIRVEIAAVIAASMIETGAARLLGNPATADSVAALMRMLDNKAMTGLVCYLMAVLSDFPSRFAFYDHLAISDVRDILRSFVG